MYKIEHACLISLSNAFVMIILNVYINNMSCILLAQNLKESMKSACEYYQDPMPATDVNCTAIVPSSGAAGTRQITVFIVIFIFVLPAHGLQF